MEHELHITVRLDGDNIATIVTEPETGLVKTIYNYVSVDEHSEFDKQIGDEIYSWISLWLDEREEV